jgi:hypothetical protein
LKERLESLINYPLGPTQFEVEWKKLVDECGIADHLAIIALWKKRDRWIAAYFKGMYYGRMTSARWSESQNRVLKDGYVNESNVLHMFARRILDSLNHVDHIDARETHYAQVMYHLQLLHWSNYNTVIISITCRGKKKHTKRRCIAYAG